MTPPVDRVAAAVSMATMTNVVMQFATPLIVTKHAAKQITRSARKSRNQSMDLVEKGHTDTAERVDPAERMDPVGMVDQVVEVDFVDTYIANRSQPTKNALPMIIALGIRMFAPSPKSAAISMATFAANWRTSAIVNGMRLRTPATTSRLRYLRKPRRAARQRQGKGEGRCTANRSLD